MGKFNAKREMETNGTRKRGKNKLPQKGTHRIGYATKLVVTNAPKSSGRNTAPKSGAKTAAKGKAPKVVVSKRAAEIAEMQHKRTILDWVGIAEVND